MSLSWTSDPPAGGWDAEYFATTSLTGAPTLTRFEAGATAISHNWGSGGPCSAPCAVGTDAFSARWTNRATLAPGWYRFSLSSDDGTRLVLTRGAERRVLLEDWTARNGPFPPIGPVLVDAGWTVVLEYVEFTGLAHVTLAWDTTAGSCIQPAGSGEWRGRFFPNAQVSGQPIMEQPFGTNFLAFTRGPGALSPACFLGPADYSARWTRTSKHFSSATGWYQFRLQADGPVRLKLTTATEWITAIDQWASQTPAGWYCANVEMGTGNRDLEVEYAPGAGVVSGVNLTWETIADPQEPCPTPPGPPAPSTLTGRVFVDRNLNGLFDGTDTYLVDPIKAPCQVEDPVEILDGVRVTWNDPTPRHALLDRCRPRPHYVVELPPATYDLNLAMPPGWQVLSGNGPVTVAAGQAATRDFRVYRCTEPVPDTRWQGEYYSGTTPGAPETGLLRVDEGGDRLTKTWGMASPSSVCGVPADAFSARFTRRVLFAPGTYVFKARSDDGVRLWLDDGADPILDGWSDHGAETFESEPQVFVAPGWHTLRVQYYDQTQAAELDVWWEAPCTMTVPTSQWRGEYFASPTFSGGPMLIRNDGAGALTFNWGDASPASGCSVPADFAVRWTRTTKFYAGWYTFHVRTDDGVRVWVNDGLILDDWTDHGPVDHYVSVPFESTGNATVRVEYYDSAGGAVALVEWWEDWESPASTRAGGGDVAGEGWTAGLLGVLLLGGWRSRVSRRGRAAVSAGVGLVGLALTLGAAPGWAASGPGAAPRAGAMAPPPATLTKSSPVGGATGQPTLVVAQWASTYPNAGYWVCWDTTPNDTCDPGWQPNGGSVQKQLANLVPGLTYYWQVKADTPDGAVYADSGAWWSFTVAGTAPVLAKQTPAAEATGVAATVLVQWTSSWVGAGYWVCADATVNAACDTGWQPAGGALYKQLSGLVAGVRYEWQVRADTAEVGSVYADTGTWRTFTVAGTAPAVTKTAPAAGAPSLGAMVTLQWTSGWTGATFAVCLDAVPNGLCDTSWTSVGGGGSYTRTGLQAGLTYEWQVEATTISGVVAADGGTWRTFTVAGTAPVFTKQGPAATGVLPPVTAQWTSGWAGATYAVCTDTATAGPCQSTWVDAGAALAAPLAAVPAGVAARWQVRATVAGVGPVEADGGTWRTFTAAPTAALTIGVGGTGSGSVTATSTASGVTLSCAGPGCQTTGVFATTDAVRLTATPAAGATWVGWTGPGCADAEVRLTGATTCVAVFEVAASGGGGSPGGDTPPAATGTQPTGPVEYVHADALGTVRAVTGESGEVVRRHDYLPFGEEWPAASGAPSRRFTGKEYDTPTGLYYFGARYLRADLGRFTTIDPVYTWTENLVDPQRWNRYSYVRNNPLKYVDPDGRMPVIVIPLLWEAGTALVAVTSVYLTTPQGQQAVRQVARDTGHMITTAVDAIGSWFQAEKAGGEPGQLKAGKDAHNNEEVRPGEKKEVPTPSGKGRMDRYDSEKAHIREVKPDNPRGERSGQRQLERYKDEMEKATKRPHTTELTKYPPYKEPR